MVTVMIEGEGGELAVEVEPEVAELLAAKDPPLKEVPFSDLLGSRRRSDEDERIGFLSRALEAYYRHGGRLAAAGASPWEGPRYSFRRLIGEGAIWHGPPPEAGPCPFCRGGWLAPNEACLGCCRTGMDLVIPRPDRETVRRCELAERARRLGIEPGGLGTAAKPKAPKAKPAPRAPRDNFDLARLRARLEGG